MTGPSDSPVRLHVVTGKGGTGKTTVAAAMALALASQGQRVLLAEVEGRQGLAQILDVAPLGTEERSLVTDPSGGEVIGLSVDAKTALLEYLQKFYKLGRAGSILEKVGAVDFATTIAPGVRDVLLIGRVYEAVGRTTKGAKKRPVFDSVVLDAPPTGRIGRFLNVNSEVSEVAKVGPVRNQADSITRLLQSPATAVHLVTLLEEMPVQETLDAIDELGSLSLRVGSVIANGVRQPLVADEDAAAVADGDLRVHEALESALAAIGVKTGPALLGGLLQEGADHVERARLQAEQHVVLRELDVPIRVLPHMSDGVESGELRLLADALADQAGL
ncbi:ArsA-related P-loop ATPase [Janibacter limosus]|uniref:ArsA-related P-loop ATPase n=1 Tax=Janibacter limosus TaxID=53458 RepID=UPI00083149E5|nr:ArsA-related P-loop ATPase [Janibacter limosus]